MSYFSSRAEVISLEAQLANSLETNTPNATNRDPFTKRTAIQAALLRLTEALFPNVGFSLYDVSQAKKIVAERARSRSMCSVNQLAGWLWHGSDDQSFDPLALHNFLLGPYFSERVELATRCGRLKLKILQNELIKILNEKEKLKIYKFFSFFISL